jgi:hypothetical protein
MKLNEYIRANCHSFTDLMKKTGISFIDLHNILQKNEKPQKQVYWSHLAFYFKTTIECLKKLEINDSEGRRLNFKPVLLPTLNEKRSKQKNGKYDQMQNEIVKLMTEGRDLREISNLLNVNYFGLRNYVYKKGFTSKYQMDHKKRNELIVKMFVEEQKTEKEVAQTFGLSLYWTRKLRLKLRILTRRENGRNIYYLETDNC